MEGPRTENVLGAHEVSSSLGEPANILETNTHSGGGMLVLEPQNLFQARGR